MREQFAVYWTLVKLQAKAQLEYRGAVNILFFAKIIGFGSSYMVMWIMLSRFKMIKGWSLYEVFFLQALYMTAYALSSAFFHNPVNKLSTQVATGEFDAILVRPVNNLIYYMFRVFSTGYIGNIALSLSMLIFSWIKLGIGINPIKIIFLLVVLFGSSLIQSAIYIISAVPNFWLIKGGSLSDLLLFDSSNFVRYPLTAFNRGIQIVLTFVIPYGFVNFYPAHYFLAKNDFLFFNPAIQYLTPFVGIILFYLSYKFWKFGVNHYQSSGS
jgi:ABC-2 type transport system permease protein